MISLAKGDGFSVFNCANFCAINCNSELDAPNGVLAITGSFESLSSVVDVGTTVSSF